MSQPMKQATLSFSNARTKRPRTGGNHDVEEPRRRPTPVSAEQNPPSSAPKPSQGVDSQSQYSPRHPTSASFESVAEIQSIDIPSNPDVPPWRDTSLSFTSCQLPPSSSSQRIVRHGERMVTNSDEDDDSSELEDLDCMISLKEQEDFGQLSEKGNFLSREQVGYPRRNSRRLKAIPNPPPALAAIGAEYQYSLASLAEQRRLLQSSGEDIAKVNAMLEARRETQSVTAQVSVLNGQPKENVIDAVMNERGDEEDADRLKDALRRTEALHRDKVWSFFQANPDAEIAEPCDFPQLRNSELRLMLQNGISRQQAFLSGFVEDYATKKDLPDELTQWIMESTCSEKREDLRLSYVHVLKELGSRDDELLSPQRIDNLFRRAGASDEALDLRKPISPSFTASKSAENVIRDHLKSILGLIRELAAASRPDTTAHAICTLCRLLLDHLVVSDCSVVTAIDEALNILIESIPDVLYEQVLQSVLPTVYGSADDPILVLQLVRNLPVYTCRTAVLRRRLALASFFRDTGYLKNMEEDPTVVLNRIARYVRTPRFAIDKQTDYAQLTAFMALLDIGIDLGRDVIQFSTIKQETEFNSAIDLISGHLRELSSQIVGTSALNMRRTEAKEILDAIRRRLSYTVRTRPPPKNAFLVNPAADHEVERERMTDFLEGKKSKALGASFVDVTGTYEKHIPIHE